MSDFSELKERLARLNPEQRALLTRRLAAGRDTSPSDVYLEMVPAVPLRTEVFGQPGESPRQIAVYPASHGQQTMWLLHEYSERLPVYVIPSSFHLVGPFDVELLMGAVADVVRRHDTLRTTFVMEDGQLFQHVASGEEFAFEAKNFQAVPEGEREAAAKRFLEEVAGRSFDLAAAPGFRVVLANLGPEEHVLCLVLHHIISDGWSRSNLWRDLAACYTARAAGAGMPSPQLPFQFVDYAAWQLRQLAGGTFEKQAKYWKAQLTGGLEPLELPSDRLRPTKESFRGARTSLVLDIKLTERLTARAREEGATLFMILLAAYKALLHRYTGSVDLLIGVPVANRQRVEVEALVGFLVNTLVMRTDLSGDPTFRELLGRVKETAIQAYAHRDMPFDRLVEMLQIPRHGGVASVFQAGFALQDFPEVSLELPDIRSTPWPVDTHTAKSDLHLAVEQTGEGWVATAEYSTDLFDADRVERMLGHWRVMLENIANDPGQTLANIPLLTEHERHRLLVDWNRTGRDYPGTHHTILSTLNAPHVAREIDDAPTGQPPSPSLVAAGEGDGATLVHWFEEQVAKTPSAPAVQFGESCLTYRELDERIRRLASLLAAEGVGRGEYVAVLLERSIDLLPTLFAIMRCGAAYVPLDADLPAARRRMILEEVQPVLVVTQNSLAPLLSGDPFPSLCVDGVGEEEIVDALTSSPIPADAAYVLYTSGSTGRPKGVVVRHDSVVNLLRSVKQRISFGGSEVVVAATSITFDMSVLELFLPLLCGGKLVLVTDAQRTDPAALVELIDASSATFFQATPSMWRMLVESGWRGSSRLVAISGGEALPSALASVLLPKCRLLWNGYGPTETTICSLGARILEAGAITIGTPLDNTRIYVVDANGRLCAPGEKGELWIGGLGVASGYLNQPELTAERFIPDPFVGVPGEKVFRTGDIVSLGTDGNVSFHGRADHQVKIRGHRIELGEIEQTLSRHPDMAHCAVTTRDGHAGLELAAYLVPRAGAELSSARLKQWLGRYLPDYMIPARFFILDALPLTAGGKTDRKALVQADCREAPIGGEREAPRYDLEKELCAIWKTILEREHIGIHDNFFDLGGNSFLVVVCCASVWRETGLEVPVRLLFDNPTIAGLAAELGVSQDKLEPIAAADRGNAVAAPQANPGSSSRIAAQVDSKSPFTKTSSRETKAIPPAQRRA